MAGISWKLSPMNCSSCEDIERRKPRDQSPERPCWWWHAAEVWWMRKYRMYSLKCSKIETNSSTADPQNISAGEWAEDVERLLLTAYVEVNTILLDERDLKRSGRIQRFAHYQLTLASGAKWSRSSRIYHFVLHLEWNLNVHTCFWGRNQTDNKSVNPRHHNLRRLQTHTHFLTLGEIRGRACGQANRMLFW